VTDGQTDGSVTISHRNFVGKGIIKECVLCPLPAKVNWYFLANQEDNSITEITVKSAIEFSFPILTPDLVYAFQMIYLWVT
jgi:hypothetical protein